jgi:outer membrane protein TolC
LWSLAPSVSASADVAEYVASGGSGPGWSVGVGASMPILGPGLADARGARAAADAARLGVEEQERGLRVALVSAEADLAAAERVIEALDVAVSASADAWSRVDALFEAGLVDVNAWIDARRARDEAAVARARATEERWAAVAATEAARGVR